MINPKYSNRRILLEVFGSNNNYGGFGQIVGGAQSGIRPIEFSVCIVWTNQKLKRAQGMKMSPIHCTYFRECSNNKTNIELFVKSKETQIAAKAPLTPMSMRPKANVGKKIGSGWSCLSNGEH